MPDVGAVFSGVAVQGRAVLGRLDPTGWRPTIIVASVLLAVVFGTQIINAALPAARPVGPGPVAAPGTAIPVGNGVYIYPPQGWVAQAAGSAAVRLTKGSVELYVRTDLTGDPATMLDTYVRQVLETAASQLTVTTPAPIPLAPGTPALRSAYVGTFDGISQTMEGQLTALVLQGRPILFDAWAIQGQLSAAANELDRMIATVEVR